MNTPSTVRLDDFTVVLGVDEKTIGQLKFSLPTWWRHKPSLFRRHFIVFFDRSQIASRQVRELFAPMLEQHCPTLQLVEWPPPGVTYNQLSADKWGGAQRVKMLSGFVHVPAEYVMTDYWLKIDTDVMSHGQDDWVDPVWFRSVRRHDCDVPTFAMPAIVAPAWNFTKPPDQMLKLDEWVTAFASDLPEMASQPPLNIRPVDISADRVGHKRICSWCAFFNTEFTAMAAHFAASTCGIGKIPVPSQDGYLWYVSKRMGLPITPVQMKNRGWRLVTHGRLESASNELLAQGT